MDPFTALQGAMIIATAGVCITSLEALSVTRDPLHRDIFSWQVLQTRNTVAVREPYATLLHRLMEKAPWIAGARGVAAALLVLLGLQGRVSWILLAFVVATLLVSNARSPYGLDGSDQMSLLVLIMLLIHSARSDDQALAVLCVWFIALQGCLAYGAAGFAKLFSPTWRSGRAIAMITHTESYGLASFAVALDRRPVISRALTWAVIVFECTFPLALVGGWRSCILFLGVGVMFHLANAFVMGLNSFVWSFLATYPALFYCASSTTGLFP